MTRILVLEDESIARRDFAEALRYNWIVDDTGNLRVAQALAADNHYDLMVVDLMLASSVHEQNGIDFAAAQSAKGVTIIIVSALIADEESRTRVRRLTGAVEVLSKPISSADLVAVIRSTLGDPTGDTAGHR